MKQTFNAAKRALIVGFSGGVGQATLSLLKDTQIGKPILKDYEKIFLIDKNSGISSIEHPLFEVLPPVKINSGEILKNIILEHEINQVIDLASLDTKECIEVCEAHGVDFLCASVEEWAGQKSVPTDNAIEEFLASSRPRLTKQSHMVGAGANPGIVNALTFLGIEEFAKQMKVGANSKSLDLYSILITENDSTREPEVGYADTIFPMTWSPRHCLEELFEPRSFVAKNNEVIDLGHAPTSRNYRVRCGDEIIEGFAVPHEETRTLAEKIPDVEIAFIYRIPQSARHALVNRPLARKVEDWHPFTVIPPRISDISGSDRLGVLLCSRTHGEFWIGFDTDVKKGLSFGTNATQLQVAAGVVAGIQQLGKFKGIHFVEDLDWNKYLKPVLEILGRPQVFFDTAAKPLQFKERSTAKKAVAEYAMANEPNWQKGAVGAN